MSLRPACIPQSRPETPEPTALRVGWPEVLLVGLLCLAALVIARAALDTALALPALTAPGLV
ncbi:MAG: hypothetical protein PHX82_11235 [Paracoccaceae bacterium]|nr:hypothetical protein [Paracoccaceae bacterium]